MTELKAYTSKEALLPPGKISVYWSRGDSLISNIACEKNRQQSEQKLQKEKRTRIRRLFQLNLIQGESKKIMSLQVGSMVQSTS